MSRLAVTLAAAALALVPAPARAACAIADLDASPVDVVARANPGPSVPGGGLLSPAGFSVSSYVKGTGPRQISVVTGASLLPSGVYRILGEGLEPHPGELWRLYGSFDGPGLLESGVCNGSHAVEADPPVAPVLTGAGQKLTPIKATFDGVTSERAPRLVVHGRRLSLRSSAPLITVRTARNGRVLTSGTGSGSAWSVRLARGESRLVVDTGDRAYALGVFSKDAHR